MTRGGLGRNGGISLSSNMLIFAVIVAISAPLVFSAFETYDRLRAENALRNELERFAGISLIYIDAGGGQAEVTVSLLDGVFHKIDYVDFGGPLNSPECASIRYKFRGEEMRFLYFDRYGLRISSRGSSLRLSSGIWDIWLKVVSTSNGTHLNISLD